MTFWSALILGLVASSHCIAMCGGLQMAMQSANAGGDVALRSSGQQFNYILLLNLGRLVTYVIAGMVFSGLGASLLVAIDFATLTYWARAFTGVIVFLIGVQILFRQRRPFQFFEPLGALVWRQVSQIISHNKNRPRVALVNGVAWGFLPCGLVYGVLLSTVWLNQPWQAGLVMLGFGLGTVPGLVLTGTLFQRFKAAISKRTIQNAAAVFFMFGGVLILSAPYWVSKEFLHNYPMLLNTVFCVY